MGLLLFLLIGGIVGWLAAAIMGRDEGIIMSVIIGIVGSFLGSFVSTLFTGGDNSFLALNITGLFWSFIGAVLLVAILNAVQGRHYAGRV